MYSGGVLTHFQASERVLRSVYTCTSTVPQLYLTVPRLCRTVPSVRPSARPIRPHEAANNLHHLSARPSSTSRRQQVLKPQASRLETRAPRVETLMQGEGSTLPAASQTVHPSQVEPWCRGVLCRYFDLAYGTPPVSIVVYANGRCVVDTDPSCLVSRVPCPVSRVPCPVVVVVVVVIIAIATVIVTLSRESHPSVSPTANKLTYT